ncbi:MAG: hypothetical protein ABJQ90_13505, partial [Parasphingorhabdus sp.]
MNKSNEHNAQRPKTQRFFINPSSPRHKQYTVLTPREQGGTRDKYLVFCALCLDWCDSTPATVIPGTINIKMSRSPPNVV